ncbi:MAG: hypothetical protein AB8B95_14330 [Pseudohongiellaceae bacterium]
MEIVEIIELGREYIVAGLEAMSLYLTIISGYLIVSYTIGNNLSIFQVIVVTGLFLAFSFFFALGTYSFFMLAHGVYLELGPDVYDGETRIQAFWIGTAQLLGVFAALAFMYDARKSEADT